MADIRWCYQLLGLKPGASLPEVKKAYRKLVREWHPDQFADDPRRRAHAGAVLTEINLAYRHLVSFLSFHRRPFEFVGPLSAAETRDWQAKTQGSAIRKWAARLLKRRFGAFFYPWRLFDPAYYAETFGNPLGRVARILGLGACGLVVVTAVAGLVQAGGPVALLLWWFAVLSYSFVSGTFEVRRRRKA